jgi:hypothetical protein
MMFRSKATSCASRVNSSWAHEFPSRASLLFSARLAHLVYWLSYKREILTMGEIRKLALSDPELRKDELLVPRAMLGSLRLPGPRDHLACHTLMNGVLSELDSDAEIVGWIPEISAVTILEASAQRCTVVIRGSATALDLVTDAAAIPWSAPTTAPSGTKGAKVHLGFLARLRQSSLVQDLAALHSRASLRELNVTGHSMGGRYE